MGRGVSIMENEYQTKGLIGKIKINLDKNFPYNSYMKFIPMDENLPWFDVKGINCPELDK